jgi:ubiquinone/menaquinone biosynthesis C-methylase UbiE
MESLLRKAITHFHSEGIPWPGSVVYNAISDTEIFNHHYELVAEDLKRYGTTERILDVGTGPARLLLALRRTFPDASLVGIDISHAMIEKARQNIRAHGKANRIKVKAASAGNLPFADKTFDRVVSTGSLHHWKNPGACMAEAYRVLEDGGYAFHYDLVRQIPKSVARKIRAQFGRFRFALMWLHSFEEPFLNVGEMEALGKQSPFLVDGIYFVGGLCCLALRKVCA